MRGPFLISHRGRAKTRNTVYHQLAPIFCLLLPVPCGEVYRNSTQTVWRNNQNVIAVLRSVQEKRSVPSHSLYIFVGNAAHHVNLVVSNIQSCVYKSSISCSEFLVRGLPKEILGRWLVSVHIIDMKAMQKIDHFVNPFVIAMHSQDECSNRGGLADHDSRPAIGSQAIHFQLQLRHIV
jgi:hypothetical protein